MLTSEAINDSSNMNSCYAMSAVVYLGYSGHSDALWKIVEMWFLSALVSSRWERSIVVAF